MTLALYGHPFANYCWKVYIAARERGLDYDARMVDPDHPEHQAVCAEANPGGQFPVLVDGDTRISESAAIIDYLDLKPGPGAFMIPENPMEAIEARMMDRMIDDYLAGPQGRLVLIALRPEGSGDPHGETSNRAQLDAAYVWFDRWMEDRTWAAADRFTLADCSAAGAIFYAHWTHPIPENLTHLHAYRKRLLARPSVAATVDDARYFRPFFPLGDGRDPDLP
ncbi:glutathione S-transferase family protein [Maritimibacter sp. DP1N21-5]|uniref:glutathione S-transferase family protein n=1 Tax=Maritimibacter sp. DP1N21-5 TaxID=2836867 RepID=UPI001C44E497|nr:glutathione S-transferase family protein [Maritimibacter sp. DP1N21-5]MBV7410503.1 glutathione S-transferase family protein [Maritimibacter sp. DP1N21-5]